MKKTKKILTKRTSSKKVSEVRRKTARGIEILEVWRKGWSTSDVFVKIDQSKDWTYDNMHLLKGHINGESPIMIFYDTK